MTDRYWDTTGLFPRPRIWPFRCPICGKRSLGVRGIRFHKRSGTGSKNPHRADVKIKCLTCAHVWTHGVLIPKRMYRGNKNVHWREMAERMGMPRQSTIQEVTQRWAAGPESTPIP